MKTFLVATLFLISANVCCQNFNTIRLNDTIYILFENNVKAESFSTKSIGTKLHNTFMYVFPDTVPLSIITYEVYPQNKQNLKVKRANFFEEKVGRIFNNENIRSIGLAKFVNEVSSKKIVIYIIEQNCIKRRKLFLKRGYMTNNPRIII